VETNIINISNGGGIMEIQGYNISMIRGDTETIKVSCKNNKGESIPFEYGDILYFTVKESVNTERKEIQKVITEFSEGIAYINITPDDTKSMGFRNHYYDIQLTRADGTVKTIIPPSIFTVKGEVTYD
jgi:hypothetical protein